MLVYIEPELALGLLTLVGLGLGVGNRQQIREALRRMAGRVEGDDKS